MHHPTDRKTHTTAFYYTSRGALAGTRNSLMGPPKENPFHLCLLRLSCRAKYALVIRLYAGSLGGLPFSLPVLISCNENAQMLMWF